MKILHTADWHISNDRLDEKIRTISNMINIANSQKVNYGVIAGDIYDCLPSVKSINALIDLLGLANFKWIVLFGNHDNKEHLDLINRFKEINVKVFTEITISGYEFSDLVVYAFPHLIKDNIIKAFNDISLSESNSKVINASEGVFNNWGCLCGDKPSIVIGHISVSSCVSASGQDLTNSGMVFNSYSLDKIGCPIMLGHIHKSQEILDNIVYSGNPCRTKFDETDEKGFYIWDYDDVWSRKFYTTNAKELITINADYNIKDGWVFKGDLCKINFKDKELKIKFNVHKNDLSLVDYKFIDKKFKESSRIVLDCNVIYDNNIRSKDIINTTSLKDKLLVYMNINGVPERKVEILNKYDIIEKELV